MRKPVIILFIVILILNICFIKTFAQLNRDTSFIKKDSLVGIWQKDFDKVGNGLNQNFEFLENGNFILDLSGNYDDVRSIIKLKGRYRLIKDKLYFTIISKTVREGKIEMVDPNINSGIFVIDDSNNKEIIDPNPKELIDPCFITVIKRNKIKINDETYYKIK